MTPEKFAAIRKALYGLVPIIGTILTAYGVVSAEKWQVIAGLLVNIGTLALAFFNTSPAAHAELAEYRAADATQGTSAAVQDSLAEAISAAVSAIPAPAPAADDAGLGGQGAPTPPPADVVNPQGPPVYTARHAAD